VIGLAEIAAPIACLGLAVLLVARTRRNRIAGLGYALVGTVLLIASLTPASAVELAVALVGAALVAPLLAWLFRREPWLIAFLTLAFIPFRIHFLHHQLLVALYAVALGAAALLLWQLVEGDDRSRELGIASWPLALYLGWIGLSVEWTVGLHAAVINLLAFYIPFTIIALSIARLPWRPSRVRFLYGELALMALVFTAVGFYQYETRSIFQNSKVEISNTYSALFRVNSVFFDPSIYGRFLVIALIPTAVLIVRGRFGRWGLAALAGAAVVWLGLLISFSQSSFAALLVAVFLLSAVVWRWKSLFALAAVVVVAGGIAVTQPKLMHALRHHTTSGLNGATSGRASLVANGIRIAKAHPALGVGLGGFEHAYSKRTHRTPRKSASHNTPVTVAAEQGGIGLILYFALLGALVVAAYRRINHRVFGMLALSAGLGLVAIFVHSLAYNDFFEDPTTWGMIGLISLAAPRRVRAPRPQPVESAEQPLPEMIAR
jgi:putative inorganic carbon (HCO3(-)) transporter